jgi:hypothetical protein
VTATMGGEQDATARSSGIGGAERNGYDVSD